MALLPRNSPSTWFHHSPERTSKRNPTRAESMPADTILHNAKIATNSVPSFVDALAITDGQITATGNERDIFRLRGPATQVIDGKGRTVIPGLNDSHMHPIRAGLSYKDR